MKYFIKYSIVIIEVIIVLSFFLYNFLTLSIDSSSFEVFVKNYFDIREKYELVDKAKVIFQTAPVIIFFFCHGIFIYKEWSIDNIYKLVRYEKREILYRKNIFFILSLSFVMSLLFVFLLFLQFIHINTDINIKIHYLLSLSLNCFAVYYSMALIFSFIAIKYGSLYSCFGTFLLWSILVVLSLYISYKIGNKIWLLILRLFIPGVNLFYCVITEKNDYLMNTISLLQVTFFTLLGNTIIKRIDIGLSDKEV